MTEFIEPKDILKNYIKGYYVVEINSSVKFFSPERVFPTGNACMVFHYRSPSIFKKKNEEEIEEPNLVLCGQQTSYYDLSLSGKTGMILVIFKPHGLSTFLNFPARELANENISLNDLFHNETAELEDKLLDSMDNNQRITILENFFIQKFNFNRYFNRIDHVIRLIEHYKGQIKMQELAEEACLGIKQFERIFQAHVGLNPKKFSGIIRLQSIIQTKNNNKKQDLAQLAFDNGYYDQSHFIHDFKNHTGISPGNFFGNK